MRELVVENQEVIIIPTDYKKANKGKVTSVSAGDFKLELENEPNGILINNYCEFYTQTEHGKLYFDSFAKEINGKTLTIASPAKHKFLQRRQYTRVKFVQNLDLVNKDNIAVKTLDISAGGLKLKSDIPLDFNTCYTVKLSLSDSLNIECKYQPIRIERNQENNFTVSGQFIYGKTSDRMLLTQYCAKRSVEIKNK